jgi:hypothetical protein
LDGQSRTAPAEKLYAPPRTTDPVNQPFNLADYLYGDAHKKHEAQYAARARAAIEAGLEPPPYEPFDPSKVENEHDRRYREEREQIERNREAARLAWNKLHPDEPVQPTPYLTWGEQHDLKLAQIKKQKEQEEAKLREALLQQHPTMAEAIAQQAASAITTPPAAS